MSMYELEPTPQNNQTNSPEEEGETITVVARRKTESRPQPHESVLVTVDSGGDNHPTGPLTELLRSLVTTQTDYDLDHRFTEQQEKIILKAIQGLMDHPKFSEKMWDLIGKGADINIKVDYTGLYTEGKRGAVAGLNSDGTVDRGESLTVYIYVKHGGVDMSDSMFARIIVHELLHTLGDPGIHLDLDQRYSTFSDDVFRDIFGTRTTGQLDLEGATSNGLTLAATSGGSLFGTAGYDVFSGSESSDEVVPGSGGSLIYSGGGNDRFILSLDGTPDEIIESAGDDTIVLPSITSFSALSTRWSDDSLDLILLVDGKREAIIVDANGAGRVEYVEIAGVQYALSAITSATNRAPDYASLYHTYHGWFAGGVLGNGATSDPDGDNLTYRIGSIEGEFADGAWTVDAQTGMISASFTRPEENQSKFTAITLIASDGFDSTTIDVTIRWAPANEYEPELSRPSDETLELSSSQVSDHLQQTNPYSADLIL